MWPQQGLSGPRELESGAPALPIHYIHIITGGHVYNSLIHSCICGCIHRLTKYSPPAPSLLLSADTPSSRAPSPSQLEETWEPARLTVSPGPLSLSPVGSLEMGTWLHLVISESIAPVQPQALDSLNPTAMCGCDSHQPVCPTYP